MFKTKRKRVWFVEKEPQRMAEKAGRKDRKHELYIYIFIYSYGNYIKCVVCREKKMVFLAVVCACIWKKYLKEGSRPLYFVSAFKVKVLHTTKIHGRNEERKEGRQERRSKEVRRNVHLRQRMKKDECICRRKEIIV